MGTLELKIPPPAVSALVAAIMWGISRLTVPLEVPGLIRVVVAVLLVLTGACIGIAGVVAFRHGKTTINPMKPQTTSTLISSGIYRFSRNPMYVGILFALAAWAIFLSSTWAMIGPVAFVLYINRFQIEPEERVLAGMFGAAYADYKSAVRRWL
jgi:protein-S-isoprenylcysteine O-methyltransferase Ste14